VLARFDFAPAGIGFPRNLIALHRSRSPSDFLPPQPASQPG